VGAFWLCLLCGDFRLRPFRQIHFKGGQYLPDEQIVPYQARDLQGLLHTKAIPYSVGLLSKEWSHLYCVVYPGGRIMYNTLSTHRHPRRRNKR
jgi:hypothetical protein